nr:amidohydrolase family protein [Sphingomonas populi]
MQIIRAGRLLPARADGYTGAVCVTVGDDGRIAAVERIDPGTLEPSEARLLLMPALSDAHDHGRGLSPLAYGAADQPLESWVVALSAQPQVDPYLNALVAFARLAESGVCAVNHCHNTQDGTALLAEAEAVSRAARDVGIHVAFAWPFFDRNPLVYGPLSPLLERLPEPLRARYATPRAMRSCAENMALFAKAKAFEHDLFCLQYHPVAPQWTEEATLGAIARASARDGRHIHTHLFETERQREWADHAYPNGLVRFLDDIGLLSPRLTIAHAIWLRDDEIALLAERGVTVATNVSSNLRLRSGMPPLSRLIDSNIGICFGLDGMALDDDQDMLRELRLARLSFARDPRLLDAFVLNASWRTGRRTIVGEDGGGDIAVGAPADLFTIDFGTLASDTLLEVPQVFPLVLARARRQHVVDMFVRGREIVSNGRCRTVDLPAAERLLVQNARAAYRAMPVACDEIDALQRAIEDYYTCGCHFAV